LEIEQKFGLKKGRIIMRVTKKKALKKVLERKRIRAGDIPVVIFENGRKQFIKATINHDNGGKTK
jgi:hypothetical protein